MDLNRLNISEEDKIRFARYFPDYVELDEDINNINTDDIVTKNDLVNKILNENSMNINKLNTKENIKKIINFTTDNNI